VEIKANDVRSRTRHRRTHRRDQRFYLETRAIRREEPPADRPGFMQDALDRTPHAGVRELVPTARCRDHGQSQAGIEAPEDGEL